MAREVRCVCSVPCRFGSRSRLSGYARLKENVTNGKADNHEGIDFYRPISKPDKSRALWGENQWPTIPTFKEKYDRWIEKMKTLGLTVMEAYDLSYISPKHCCLCFEADITRMADGLGMTSEEWVGLRSQVDDSFWVMRIIGMDIHSISDG
jgi:hypothetical protein